MKAKIRMPIDGTDVKVRAFDEDGQEVHGLSRIEIEPLFYRSSGNCNILFGSIVVNDKETQKFSLSLAGRTGNCRMIDRTEPVVPRVERKPEKSENKEEPANKPNAAGVPSDAPEDIDLPDASD